VWAARGMPQLKTGPRRGQFLVELRHSVEKSDEMPSLRTPIHASGPGAPGAVLSSELSPARLRAPRRRADRPLAPARAATGVVGVGVPPACRPDPRQAGDAGDAGPRPGG